MRKEVIVLIIVAFVFSGFTLFEGLYHSNFPIVGNSIFGTIGVYVIGEEVEVIIHHPINTTYNFAIGSNYTLDLNVSTGNGDIDKWWYTLEDLRHNTVVNQSIIFTPNTVFNAVRWSNKLTVYANNTAGTIGSASVIFYVSVPNSAPLLGNISSPILACESSSLSKSFNATDADEDNLQVSISPTTPFFVFPTSFSGATFIVSEIFSSLLSKSNVGNHSRTISITDGVLSDSKPINITVIEINNIPNVLNIGVQTVYLQGVNSTFNKTITVSDTENGNQNSGNITFNLSFNGGSNLFNISSFGNMYFAPNSSHLGVYNLTYCATDRSLSYIHPNISLCSNTGLNNTVCKNFSLTVTDENRAPTILNYYPLTTSFNASGTQNLNFNITSFDPDGTIPDVYWYVDGVLSSYVQNNLVSTFSYTYSCGLSGNKNVRVVITDGLLNDSLQWNITLSETACPISVTPPGGGGGGGGGASTSCLSQWGCNDWNVCQNTKRSLELGLISGDDYREITESCAAKGFDESKCGFQTRSCYDNAFCNSTIRMPASMQFCDYTINPSCYDGIKNCHDGTCELLIDCGGPCNLCPSCSDKTQNQGELGVDCGGPCPFQCPAETPFLGISFWRTILIWLFWLILLLLLILLISRIIKLIKIHNEMSKERRIQSALSR